jgi:hypothetical protein
MQRTSIILSVFTYLVAAARQPTPPNLFDPLIAEKLAATYDAQPTIPSVYPQYTTRDTGEWIYFAANGWTTGFLPSTFYALHERAKLCPQLGLDGDAWLARGRSSSTGEIGLETHNTQGHDVGFLSFPFAEELLVYVIYFLYLSSCS